MKRLLKTFEIRKICVPDSHVQVEISPKGFRKLVNKVDANPILESEDALFFIPESENVIYYCKKEPRQK